MQAHKWTARPARSGQSLPNAGEACATGGNLDNWKGFPAKRPCSRCKQEPCPRTTIPRPGKETDTHRSSADTPDSQVSTHGNSRCGGGGGGVDGKGRDFSPDGSVCHCLDSATPLPMRFSIPLPPTTDEMKNNRMFLGRHRPIALSWDRGIERRRRPTATFPGSTGRGRRRARWPSRPDDFAMCVPALDSQHRQGRIVASYPPSFLAFGLQRRRIGRCRIWAKTRSVRETRRRVCRECSSPEASHQDMASALTGGTKKLSD